MKKMLLLILVILTVTAGLLPMKILAQGSDSMPTIGFEVRMNPHQGSQFEKNYYNGDTLEVYLAEYVSAYIKPYVDAETGSTPWNEHIYYTFTLHNVIDGIQTDDNNIFGVEKRFNDRNNTTSKNWIVIDDLSEERLGTSYYQIVVKAYRSNSWGQENPASDPLLGTATANLHVLMTPQSKIQLDWLDSYFWDQYFIENDLEQIYASADEILALLSGTYNKTIGCDAQEINFLSDIPVTWTLKAGTVYSAAAGATNTFTWTANPQAAPGFDKWEIPAGFALSQDVVFQNPYAVTFKDGNTVVDVKYIKNGGTLTKDQFPPVPQKAGYSSRWSIETDLVAIGSNVEVQVVYTPISRVYTIWAVAGSGGSISPSGVIPIREGGSQMFVITPDPGYCISSVQVDRVDVGAISVYGFTNVAQNHIISVTFSPEDPGTVIDPGEGEGPDVEEPTEETEVPAEELPEEELSPEDMTEEVPKTGDITQAVLPAALIGFAVCLAAAVRFRSKAR